MTAPTADPRARVHPPSGVAPVAQPQSRLSALRESLPDPLLRAGRRTVSLYGSATARWRTSADFLIIGTKRGGTTSLYHHLVRHPSVLELFPSTRLVPKRRPTKGLHFFDAESPGDELAYRSHFPTARARIRAELTTSGPVVVGEASPYYLFHPTAASRAVGTVPDAKLIAILRDPVERTYSHYREEVRNGVETLSFEAALEAEQQRLGDSDPIRRRYAHEHQSYASQSQYAAGVARWLQMYPREQLLVLSSEEYYARPAEVVQRVMAFLGLPAEQLAAPPPLNSAPSKPMAPETRARLAEQFEPHNETLFALLGQSFDWQKPHSATDH